MIQKIFVDCDGVVADFVGGFCEIHGIPNPYDNSRNWGKGDLRDTVPNWKDKGDSYWFSVCEQEFWANLPKLPWADTLVKMCEERCPGHVYFLTKPTWNNGCPSGKYEWIGKHFPEYLKGGKVLIGASKHLVAAPDRLLIDDHLNNCREFIESGGNAMLWPAKWNRLCTLSEDRYLNLVDNILRDTRVNGEPVTHFWTDDNREFHWFDCLGYHKFVKDKYISNIDFGLDSSVNIEDVTMVGSNKKWEV